MEDYKFANIKKYLKTHERNKFAEHPSKIVGIESFRRCCKRLALPNESILDIGGGSGIQAEIFKDENIQLKVFALDLSLSMLKERHQDDICTVGDMENLPFKDNSLDRAFFFASLHHVKNTERAVSEAKRVVRRGGHIVLCEPISLRLLLLGKNIEAVYGDKAEFCFSLRYLFRILRKLELQLTYVYYRGFFRRILPNKSSTKLLRNCEKLDNIINHIPLLRWLGSLGDKVTIIAQKR